MKHIFFCRKLVVLILIELSFWFRQGNGKGRGCLVDVVNYLQASKFGIFICNYFFISNIYIMKLYFYLDSFVAGSEGITCPPRRCCVPVCWENNWRWSRKLRTLEGERRWIIGFIFAKREKKNWLEDQHLSRLSRQYVNGLHFGRNSIGTNHKLLAQQLRDLLLFNLSMIFESEVEYFETVSNLFFLWSKTKNNWWMGEKL